MGFMFELVTITIINIIIICQMFAHARVALALLCIVFTANRQMLAKHTNTLAVHQIQIITVCSVALKSQSFTHIWTSVKRINSA